MKQYKLYGRRGSGSLAVQVALEEIGAPYERIWISTDPTEVAAYRKINPVGRVPALQMPDGTLIAESAAILIHLSLAHPGAGLHRCRARSNTHAFCSGWCSCRQTSMKRRCGFTTPRDIPHAARRMRWRFETKVSPISSLI